MNTSNSSATLPPSIDMDAALRSGEHQRLEFKASGVLRNKAKVVKEVVGMLNSEGGDVIIGVDEPNDQVFEIAGVRDAPNQVGPLLDHLLDTIEPRPSGTEVVVDTIALGDTLGIRVHVARSTPDRRPFARTEGDGRWFHVRHADRNRHLGRAALERAFRTAFAMEDRREKATTTEHSRVHTRLMSLRDAAVQGALGPGLSVHLLPSPRLKLPFDTPAMKNLLSDPSLTGNREEGWQFASRYNRAEHDGVGARALVPGKRLIALDGNGEIRLWVSAPLLHWKGAEKSIYPLCLVEHIVAVSRLMSTILNIWGEAGTDPNWDNSGQPGGGPTWKRAKPAGGGKAQLAGLGRARRAPKNEKETGPNARRTCSHLVQSREASDSAQRDERTVWADVVLSGMEGWSLGPFSPDSIGNWMRAAKELPGGSLILSELVSLDASTLQQRPDQLGVTLVQAIYRALGFSPDQLPREIDQDAGKLVMR